MQAREIMTEDPVCCSTNDSIRTVAKEMLENSCGFVPVVDNAQNKQLVGVITDRDIVCRILAKDGADYSNATVQNAMTTGHLWTVRANASVDDVIEAMEEGQVRRIPVVDDGNKIIGVISTADVALEVDDTDDIAEVFEEISEPTHIPHA
ncbi:MAG TPA: CBS domain-containing protein [Armatimonadota bacterium]|nr:CBS domain-containing protein [Armatimonadota bacterium]